MKHVICLPACPIRVNRFYTPVLIALLLFTSLEALSATPSPDDFVTTWKTDSLVAQLTLQKEWVGGVTGDQAMLQVDGANGPVLNTSTATGGDEIDTVNTAVITALVGETTSLSESFLEPNIGDYSISLSCNGTNPPTYTLGEPVATLLIDAADADTAITCTFTNTISTGLNDFVTTWKTDNPGSSNGTSITVPMVGGPYEVDWNNDGIFDSRLLNGSVTHDFKRRGTYTIRIRGSYQSIRFDNGGDKEKILSLDQWGTQSWTTMRQAFFGTKNLVVPAKDTPNFSAVTNMSSMFSGATSANPDTSGWDTSAVTNMSSMFSGATSANPDTSLWDTAAVTAMGNMFNGAISANPDTSGWDTATVELMWSMFQGATLANPDTGSWDTSSVTDMAYMFNGATSANPDTSGWDTIEVMFMSDMFAGATSANPDTSSWRTARLKDVSGMFKDATSANPDTSGWLTLELNFMSYMFAGAISANPDTSGWDTAKVTNMSYMFAGATSANPDTSGWDTVAVEDMSGMFEGATSANPDTSGWWTQSVTDMSFMFDGAKSFDRDIGSWDVSALINATDMFNGVTLSAPNYESLLVGWNAQALQSGVFFDGGNSKYCSEEAVAARTNMMASDSWVITDGGLECPPVETCNVNITSGVTEYFDAVHEACEILVLGPDFIVADGANISASSGWEIEFMPGFMVEQGATLSANVCGQSLCMVSDSPMPYGCHSCVDQICDIEPLCCALEFDQACLDKVDTVCGLVCE